jgi:hypothetical protein
MKRFSLVLAAATLGALVVASAALGVHARPQSASPLTFQLVPAFEPFVPGCPGRTVSSHGPPLVFPSCNPPDQVSDYLTATSPDRAAPFNLTADGTGTVVLKVTCLVPPGTTTPTGQNQPCPAPGDQSDVLVTSSSTGVRCVQVSGGCSAPAALYNGKVLGSSQIEITDHHNNTTGQPCNTSTSCPASVIGLPFTIGSQCTGGACNYVTSADGTVPDVVKEGKRAVVELGIIQIFDAGADGGFVASAVCPPTCEQNADGEKLASVQGLFIP